MGERRAVMATGTYVPMIDPSDAVTVTKRLCGSGV